MKRQLVIEHGVRFIAEPKGRHKGLVSWEVRCDHQSCSEAPRGNAVTVEFLDRFVDQHMVHFHGHSPRDNGGSET